ncbi:MAG TPA: hypothetical protein VNV37_06885 [Solirubrobacteraceae bacterium]|jgi:hypothetical protein|nr:hypothetical protein [Solirubrobacteraceae bacterium]
MLVQFMFSPTADDAARKALIATLRQRGAHGVRRAFPRAPSERMERIYSIDVANGHESEMLQVLNKSADVDFAEVEAPRWLAHS